MNSETVLMKGTILALGDVQLGTTGKPKFIIKFDTGKIAWSQEQYRPLILPLVGKAVELPCNPFHDMFWVDGKALQAKSPVAKPKANIGTSYSADYETHVVDLLVNIRDLLKTLVARAEGQV